MPPSCPSARRSKEPATLTGSRAGARRRVAGAVAALSLLLLTGCAASVRQGPIGATASAVPPASSRAVALVVTGSPVSTGSADWEPFKGEWRAAMAAAAAERGASFSSRETARPTGEPGTLVVVDVADYRYLTPGARFGFGIMTGNAYIDAEVRLLDLADGRVFDQRRYNTSSSAWQGVFSAMTDKQVRAIADTVMAEVSPP